MESTVKGVQDALGLLDGLVGLMVTACLVYIAARVVGGALGGRRLARTRRFLVSGLPRPGRVIPSTFGLIATLTLPAAAHRRVPAAPSWRAPDAAAPPWSATSGFAPPRPLVRIRAQHDDLSKLPAPPAAGRSAASRRDGHAAGGRSVASPRRLDPDETPDLVEQNGERRRPEPPAHRRPSPGARPYDPPRDERARSRARHPAGRTTALCPEATHRHRVVVYGDTLWDIAAEVLETDDVARISRYWPLIHHENRSTIGADPSLIYPGTVLELPPECAR
ncbi:MAG TPA: hypothetical protein VIG64_09600 [Actinomycetota bacterium]